MACIIDFEPEDYTTVCGIPVHVVRVQYDTSIASADFCLFDEDGRIIAASEGEIPQNIFEDFFKIVANW